MTITLRDIDIGNYEAAAELKLNDDQIRFIRPNAFSMLQAIYLGSFLYQKAIYHGDEMVGYAMMGQDPDDQTCFISRFMIAADHQGKGYGRAGMELVIEDMKARYHPDALYIRVHPDNTAARKLYESLGFEDTGDVTHGELQLILKLNS
jgi:diamine N-acetyltransferase